ncbi:MAG: acyl-ACP--UDP-N-acetylglucosamine O-acyltransferase [Notoacmeibacter sp.]|nr:acyl-ACP--UDP-N-acetylglucosamine O-acyltransferase [Notoacmeibacter sp.]MCC0033182.1 acyl-ACP--UDP-N-acetylglucosamine O-acyltransferase [Brucellaceae bacterium]
MAAEIHPTAVIEPGAVIGDGARIGPFCMVGPQVVLGANVHLIGHVTVLGQTTIGEGTKVYPQAVLGCDPQNHGHKGGPSTLEIGRNNTIREGVTMHTGTDTARARTTVGDNCHFLGYSHVAHDCAVGNNVTMTQGAVLGGHCEVGDFAILGGLSAVHQFVRIGHHAFVGGMSGLERDLIPYGMVTGNRGRLRGLNVVGMRRSGVSRDDMKALRAAYKMMFNPARPVLENIPLVQQSFAGIAIVDDLLAFMTERGRRQFVMPAVGGRASGDDGVDGEA